MFKKLIICSILLLCLNQVVKSQQTVIPRTSKLGIGIEAILGGTKYGTGYFLNYQSSIYRELNWTLTLEAVNLKSTLKVNPRRKYEYLASKMGAKYFLNKQLYVSGDIGLAFDQLKPKNTQFIWSPGIGVELNVFGRSALDIGGKYESYQPTKTIKFFALKLALNLGL